MADIADQINKIMLEAMICIHEIIGMDIADDNFT